MLVCFPCLAFSLIGLHIYAIVLCADARATKGVVLTVISLVCLITGFVFPIALGQGASGNPWPLATIAMHFCGCGAATYGTFVLGQRADMARGELDRGEGLRKASNALLGIAVASAISAVLGGFVYALSRASGTVG